MLPQSILDCQGPSELNLLLWMKSINGFQNILFGSKARSENLWQTSNIWLIWMKSQPQLGDSQNKGDSRSATHTEESLFPQYLKFIKSIYRTTGNELEFIYFVIFVRCFYFISTPAWTTQYSTISNRLNPTKCIQQADKKLQLVLWN